MPQKITISVIPSDSHPDVLAVKDAMEQILDFFQLIQNNGDLVWRLVSVQMNSPLSATAEAISFVPDFDYNAVAKEEVSDFRSNYSSLIGGSLPEQWSHGKNQNTLKRILKRNLNGIGKIILDFHEGSQVISIVPSIAEAAIQVIERSCIDIVPIVAEEPVDRTHKELGTIDGLFLGVGTYYRNPAIFVKNRLTNADVTCVVPQELHDNLSAHTKISDVWRQRRIFVRGVISFDKDNHIYRVDATDIEMPDSENVPLDSILDDDFTHGLSSADYLNLMRG